MILPVLLLGLLADYYILCAINSRCTGHRRTTVRTVYTVVACVLQLALLVAVCWPKRRGSDDGLDTIMWILFGYMSVYIPKFVFCIFDLLASVPRLWHGHQFKPLTWVGIVVGVFIFGAMWWGALINRFDIEINRIEITDTTLPDSFDGLTIAQISDLHTGTFGDDTTFVADLVDSINALRPDMVVFTGDIVSRRSSELTPFTNVLKRLDAPLGVYSILGNHDYGDYYAWPSAAEKEQNMQELYQMQHDMGWRLLRNNTAWIHHDNDSIAIIGVENVGDPPFHVYGDLKSSYPGSLSDRNYKILLSHNPAHWVREIAPDAKINIALTLSGHTHAMQMSVMGKSPAAWRYPTWGGLYDSEDGHRRLYVNIGAGEVGIPARIGANPEITLITLRR